MEVKVKAKYIKRTKIKIKKYNVGMINASQSESKVHKAHNFSPTIEQSVI